MAFIEHSSNSQEGTNSIEYTVQSMEVLTV